MILKEAQKVGLPIIGLVNSNCHVEIEYPIFGQDQASDQVHFFCHFLAALIAKETVDLQHKRYTLQKKLSKLLKKNNLKDRPEEKALAKQKKRFTLNKSRAFLQIKNS